MINFVSIYGVFLAKIENTISLFHHKSVEVEGHMAFTAMFKQQYQKMFPKSKPFPTPITKFVKWLVCLQHYCCRSRLSTTAGRNLSFKRGLKRVEKVRPCVEGGEQERLHSEMLQCGVVKLILPEVVAGGWRKPWPLGGGKDCPSPWWYMCEAVWKQPWRRKEKLRVPFTPAVMFLSIYIQTVMWELDTLRDSCVGAGFPTDSCQSHYQTNIQDLAFSKNDTVICTVWDWRGSNSEKAVWEGICILTLQEHLQFPRQTQKTCARVQWVGCSS